MGRNRYTPQERNKITANFIRCAREIIDLEGIQQVSIRKVAQTAGLNSATLYLYFDDVENYCRTLAADIPHLQSAYEIYLHTWKVFCLHAFSHPLIFYHLFFRPHSKPLAETVLRYYEIYPGQLAVTDGPVREMLLAGDLEARNQKVLAPLAQEGFFPAAHLPLINDLTICYFRKLLEECDAQSGTLANQQQTDRMLAAIQFLTAKSE